MAVELIQYLYRLSDVNLDVIYQESIKNTIYDYQTPETLCKKNKIPLITTSKITPKLIEKIRQKKPDIILNAYFSKIFPPKLFNIPRLGTLNIHPGKLPFFRGAFPTPWYILNNEKYFYITIHYINEKIDSGDILVQKKFPIYPGETGHELYKRTMKLSTQMYVENFYKIISNKIKPLVQKGYGSYFNKIESHYKIDWHQSRKNIEQRVRVHAPPYFPAYSFIFNKCITIKKVSFYDSEYCSVQGSGIICKVLDNMQFVVTCTDGCLLIEDYDLFPKLKKEDVQVHIRVGHRFI